MLWSSKQSLYFRFPTAKLCINPILLFRAHTKMNKEEIHMHLSLLTPWSKVVPEKLTSSQLVKKFPAFHGI
jgi:hypothetical protein